jgi:rhamnosyltransferase
MAETVVTVAIPTFNCGSLLEQTLQAVRAQRLAPPLDLELVVCDSGSEDGSVQVARRFGAEVIEIASGRFSHGGTRNLLMERSRGEYVAFLTQDSIPADELWLGRLLAGFSLAGDVAQVFGPYRPRADATPMIARELTQWFASFSPDGSPRVDRLSLEERSLPARALLGPRGFFTDANGCLSRAAWESVPFRPVAYAEDHLLAHDMLRAGYAKVFMPAAAVVHSHDYSATEWLRRSFDEARAMQNVYGLVPPAGVRRIALNVWGGVGADWRWSRGDTPADHARGRQAALIASSLSHHLSRQLGTALGARADRLPEHFVRRLSLERRDR